MRRCPKVGDRVRYPGSIVVGACEGTVVAIYPQFEPDAFEGRPTGKLLPEAQWHVGVRVDRVPVPWCYDDSDRFAPAVAVLRPVARSRRAA